MNIINKSISSETVKNNAYFYLMTLMELIITEGRKQDLKEVQYIKKLIAQNPNLNINIK